ncbi:MAG: hypothetical protein OEZ41_09645 [Nitrospirota bacterium]|nr:hypothetical protein [Nitrospirota bacterium]MDH5700209.1 hypothetical protein [Nitrospirota bacterium]
MPTTLRFEHIESAIQALPTQGRTMLQLLLLQYMDVSQEAIDYMASDQPDSRFGSGNQPTGKTLSLEAVRNVTSRANQYKDYYRQKRERPGMHIEFLTQALTNIDKIIQITERLLTSDFGSDENALQAAKTQAPSILLRQELRKLERGWDNQELSPKEYQAQRLLLEYQALLRRRGILRRRLKAAQSDFIVSGNSPLKDHEIAHVWGIPLGSLAARKVKALQQFLTKLQQHQEIPSAPNEASQPIDLWQETLHLLSRRPIERSMVEYDGLEKTEEALLDKLRAFVSGNMSEPEESKFWTSITKVNDTEFSGTWKSHARSILAFQRLHALLNDMDFSDEGLEEELRAKIYPQLPDDQLATESEEKPVVLGEMGLGVLSAFSGEQDDKRRG